MAATPFDFSKFEFHPVIAMPEGYEVYDFTKSYDPKRPRASTHGVGRYDEKRSGMYETELFDPQSSHRRDVHIGVDLAAPVGTEVHAFYDGVIFLTAINPAPGDYGGTIVTEHRLGERTIWALHGHLSHASVAKAKAGAAVKAGDVIGWLGDESENGGWNPHVHFQLSWLRPEKCDMPGVVADRDREQALRDYPDPRLVLGRLY
ncbi:MAG: peptidoglycan DD-metalloendopeptidase family protein [Bdellovibrionota bacterium]